MSDIDDPTTLIVGVPDDAATFDVVFANTPRSVDVIMNTYEPLMTNSWKENDQGLQHWVPDKVEGAALTSMSVAADGVTWTLKVREGVRFPSGDAVTAEAVKGVFDRNFGVKGSGGAFLYRSLGRIPGPDAVEIIDEATVRTHDRSPQSFAASPAHFVERRTARSRAPSRPQRARRGVGGELVAPEHRRSWRVLR